MRADSIDPHDHRVLDKIRAAMKLMTFRNQNVLVQFWSPCVVGKDQLLTAIDQPYGFGVICERLLLYRKDSERNVLVANDDPEEKDLYPPARVYRRGLPEWTSDLTNYLPKQFPLQERAIRCNLHGYLALPVSDATTSSCVGVLELLASSKYTTFAYEVQQIHSALKTQNLTCPQVFDDPALNVLNESRQNELDKILGILKSVCDTHNLPLAQTWAVSPSTSFVSHDKFLEKSCSSFDTKCIGKVCMSTNALPFYVRDLEMWSFRESCRKKHLDKSRGFVGRALLARGSSYCEDITQVCEEEYPLVHNARTSRLTSCFTIFLRSVQSKGDYVLEFFLSFDSKDGRHVSNLVRTLKLKVELASGFELGEILPIEVTQTPRDASYLSLSTIPQTNLISSATTANTLVFGMDSSAIESLLENSVITGDKQVDIIIDADVGVKSNSLKRRSKRKIDSHRVKVKANFKRSFVNIRSRVSLELMILKREVARRFNLDYERLRLKYRDEDNDKILIGCDVDLALAFETSGRNSISIICEAD